MDKNAFISLLRHHNASSQDDLAKLISLRREFPYSQVLVAMLARAARDHDAENHSLLLQEAAVYASDRAALKEIFSDDFIEVKATAGKTHPDSDDASTQVQSPVKTSDRTAVVKDEAKEKEIAETDPITAARPVVTPVETTGIDYAEELIKDLETLNTLKHNFEMLFVEYSEVHPTTQPAVTRETVEKVDSEGSDEETSTADAVEGAKDRKSKKARIIELAKTLGVTQPPLEQASKRVRRRNPSEALIDEIQSTKEELTPESEAQKEQIEIINQFIRTQPSISPVKERTPPSTDLTPVKSGEFSDNVVSETLVEILIKQGKKEKAIEVLKKLIWKYPQKKTYFASQIEDLKK